jgi:hypothetical protein
MDAVQGMLEGGLEEVVYDPHISLAALAGADDDAFYSYAVQAGCLAAEPLGPNTAIATVPNRELAGVWSGYIRKLYLSDET